MVRIITHAHTHTNTNVFFHCLEVPLELEISCDHLKFLFVCLNESLLYYFYFISLTQFTDICLIALVGEKHAK